MIYYQSLIFEGVRNASIKKLGQASKALSEVSLLTPSTWACQNTHCSGSTYWYPSSENQSGPLTAFDIGKRKRLETSVSFIFLSPEHPCYV